MDQKKAVLRTVFIFTAVMAAVTLIYMLLTTIVSNKNKMVIDTDSMKLVQLEPVKDGDPVAIVETSLGEIRMRLFPEYSPEAVKNFTELAESGYYDNTYFFQSESGAYSAAGAKKKDGTMPEGYDKERELVKRELNQDLWPFRGAVVSLTTTVDRSFTEALFGGGTYYCGSRFAFVNSIEFTDEVKEQLKSISSDSEELAEAFIEKGGVPNFSQQMTVFGQVYEGLDVVDKLSSLETETNENSKYKIPKDDIMIISVEIGEYSDKEDSESSTSAEKNEPAENRSNNEADS